MLKGKKFTLSCVINHTIFLVILLFAFFSSVSAYEWKRNGNAFVRWEQLPVEVQIDVFDFPIGSQEHILTDTAIARWDAIMGTNLRLLRHEGFIGQSSLQNEQLDGINSIGYESLSTIISAGGSVSTLGITVRTYVNDRMIEADIALVDPQDQIWNLSSPAYCNLPVSNLFLTVMLHELGHLIGFDHSSALPNLMHPSSPGAMLSKNGDMTPTADEVRGVRDFYPNPSISYVDLAAGRDLAGGNDFERPRRIDFPYGSNWDLGDAEILGLFESEGFITLPYAIHNLGTAQVTDVLIRFYLSNDRDLNTPDTKIGETTIGSINSGDVFVSQERLSIPGWFHSGSYYVGYRIDPLSGIKEAQEDNNEFITCGTAQIEQGPTAYVTVGTSHPNAPHQIDGTTFDGTQLHKWPTTSSHVIRVDSVLNLALDSRLIFEGWGGGSPTQPVIERTHWINRSFIARYRQQYFLRTAVDGSGTVSIGTQWLDSGTVVSLTATAAPGFCFAGWEGEGKDAFTGFDDSIQITLNAPVKQTAIFLSNASSVVIGTGPPNVPFSVDGRTHNSQLDICWALNETHWISVDSVVEETDSSRLVFSGWSDGGGLFHKVTPTTSSDLDITAQWTRQFFVDIRSDGYSTVLPLSGWYDSGAVINLSVIPDCDYQFSSWSGSGSASYTGNESNRTLTVNSPIRQRVNSTYYRSNGHFELSQPDSIGTKDDYGWIDIDSDGDYDFWSSEFLSGYYYVTIWLNVDGALIASSTIRTEKGFWWLDFDGDQDLDIILFSNGQLKIATYSGGHFIAINEMFIDPTFEFIDIDNDGDLDLWTEGGTTSSFLTTVYINDGYTLIRNEQFNSWPNNSGWIDVDNDGDQDFWSAGSLHINVGGQIDSTIAIPGVSGLSGWIDINSDGKLDITSTDLIGRTRAFLNMSDSFLFIGRFPGARTAGETSGWFDFDADGDKDYWCIGCGSNSGVYINNGLGFDSLLAIPIPFTSEEAGWLDFDNDGDMDLWSRDNNSTTIYTNDQGQLSISATLPPYGEWIDIDSDGDLDFWSAGIYLQVFMNNSGQFQQYPMLGFGNGSLHWFDIDGDGLLDIWIRDERLSNMQVFQNTGNGFKRVLNQNGISSTFGWLDLDSDGSLDMWELVPRTNQNNLKVYLNTGGTISFNGSFSVNSSAFEWLDYDGDGDYDLTASFLGGIVAIYPSASSCGSHWIKVDLASITGKTEADIARNVSVVTGGGHLIQDWGGKRLQFGLGSSTVIDRIIVEWANGTKQELQGISSDTLISIREPRLPRQGTLIAGDSAGNVLESESDTVIATLGNSISLQLPIDSSANIVSFRWQHDGHPLYDGQNITGSATQQLTVTNVTMSDSGYYALFSTNSVGTVKSQGITIIVDVLTGIEDDQDEQLPRTYSLSQNYPNPFNPSTIIEFELPSRSTVNLRIYNILGQVVKDLLRQDLPAGSHQITWDGTTSSGSHVASGIYFYKLEANGFVDTKKMVLLK